MSQECKHQFWFESWFDSPYYHLLYQHRDKREAKDFIDRLIQHLSLPPRATLLDLACGKGRHSIHFAQNNLLVTGLDLSPQSIHYAQQFEKENLSFFTHDMRLPFRVNYFDAVMNLFTSFGYFEKESDNLKTIESAALSMKPGALLVIDFMNSKKVLRKIQAHEKKKVDDISFDIRKQVLGGFLVKDIKFEHNGVNYQFSEKVKPLKLEDFQYYFKQCGLKLETCWGDYKLNPYNETDSDRMILIARKA